MCNSFAAAESNKKKGSRDDFPFLSLKLVKFKNSHERTLRNFHCSDLTHPLLTLLLFLQELSLTADITTITLRGHILTDSLHGLTGNDLCSDRRLDSDIELLAWDEFLEFLTHLVAEIVGVISVDKRRKGIGWIAIEKNIELHKLGFLESDDMIVE